jgi:hypothetical protein
MLSSLLEMGYANRESVRVSHTNEKSKPYKAWTSCFGLS